MKKLLIYGFWLSLGLFVISCNKETFGPEDQIMPEQSLIPVDTLYDNYLASLAYAVHQSLDDSNFSTALKKEVMLQPDGDYDVLLKSFNRKYPEVSARSLFTNLSGTKGSSGMPEVLEKYPKTQVSIPVKADRWNGSDKLWVLYLPSNYDEFATKEVPAISPAGKRTMFNVEKEPDFPVIIVSQSERSNNRGELKYEFNRLREKYDFNLVTSRPKEEEGIKEFTATPVTNAMAVALNWSFVYPDYLQPYDFYFEIYRDDLTGGGFVKVGEADTWQTSYYDMNGILPTRTYIYYIIARVDYYQTYLRNEYEYYFYSETDEAALTQIPNFTNNFSVKCIGPTQMELTWTINNISNWTNLRIERYTTYSSAYQTIAELPITTLHYMDDLYYPSPAYSVKYRYRLTVYNTFNGASQETYCDEMLSNRIDEQNLKITRVQFNTFDDMRRYEAWTRGAPEVQLYVQKVVDNAPSKWIDNINIGGPASSGFNCNYGISVWSKDDAKVYTITLNEQDGGSNQGLEISLGASLKLPKVFGTEISVSFNVKGIIFKGSNDDCIGTGYLYWWDDANGKAVQCGAYCKATFLSVQN